MNALRFLRRLLPPIGLAIAGGLGCNDQTAPQAGASLGEQLDANWSLWQAQGVTTYDYEFRWICFCVAEVTDPVIVTVVDNSVTRVTYADTGESVDPNIVSSYPTINQLFLLVENAIVEEADVIRVDFDESRGFPVDASFDYDTGVVDEELGFSAGQLQIP